ncbi:hypothetical protein IPJ63_03355 [Candidatus Nomurabacteria bacterium]|nr:MAG: hypothetical protein IPJ63_03355 [Candidatus Nomurabacteria bacterium]
MKKYLTTIKYTQEILLGISILAMMILPLVLVFSPNTFNATDITNIYNISHVALFFVMIVRPMADIFMENKWIRPLVILRKGAGVLSASIIVSFIFAKIIMDPGGYLNSFFTLEYWSMVNYAVLAHMGDITAIILLITSNSLSKRLLGDNWKRIQKLSYVYFYSSSLYVFLTYGHIDLAVSMILVTIFTALAYFKNRERKALIVKTI